MCLYTLQMPVWICWFQTKNCSSQKYFDIAYIMVPKKNIWHSKVRVLFKQSSENTSKMQFYKTKGKRSELVTVLLTSHEQWPAVRSTYSTLQFWRYSTVKCTIYTFHPQATAIGMCGMDFSSSVWFRFWETPRVQFGSGKPSVWFGLLCRSVVKYKNV